MVKALKSVGRSWINRTWKRETAGIMLVFWLGWTTFLLMVAPLDRMAAGSGIHTTVTMAVFAFAMAAFGFDAVSKQLGLGPKPP